MLKRARDGYFALGLIIGLLAATIFLVSIAHLEPSGSEKAQAEESQSSGEAAEQKYGKSYWRWSGLVSTEDTLAQWVMSLLSIVAVALSAVAVWFVGKTLIATQKMARDTREIGEAQVRAYLTFDVEKVEIAQKSNRDGTNLSVKFIGKVWNHGNSPAFDYRFHFTIDKANVDEVIEAQHDGSDMQHATDPVMSYVPPRGHVRQTLSRVFKIDWPQFAEHGYRIRMSYVIEYTDVFWKTIKTVLVSGTVMEHPKGSGNLIFTPDSLRPAAADRQ